LCEFCTAHGEGKKWYEVMEHYSQDLLKDPQRRAYIGNFIRSIRTSALTNMDRLDWTKRKLPFIYKIIRQIATLSMKTNHYGQVVPLEDAERILDMVHSITRIPCICRSVTTGKNNARYCLLLGIDPTGFNTEWPELEASLETLTPQEAKELLREFDQKGLVHSIWTFKTPFIGAICNCDHDCLAYKFQISSELLNTMFKAEYLAHIEQHSCVGCRHCQRVCQFGAVEYSLHNQKCYINLGKCYGCGVCRAACKKQAITLWSKDEPLPSFQA